MQKCFVCDAYQLDGSLANAYLSKNRAKHIKLGIQRTQKPKDKEGTLIQALRFTEPDGL